MNVVQYYSKIVQLKIFLKQMIKIICQSWLKLTPIKRETANDII